MKGGELSKILPINSDQLQITILFVKKFRGLLQKKPKNNFQVFHVLVACSDKTKHVSTEGIAENATANNKQL